MAAVAGEIQLTDDDIPGVKSTKEVQKLTRAEALPWLKCRGCRSLSEPCSWSETTHQSR